MFFTNFKKASTLFSQNFQNFENPESTREETKILILFDYSTSASNVLRIILSRKLACSRGVGKTEIRGARTSGEREEGWWWNGRQDRRGDTMRTTSRLVTRSRLLTRQRRDERKWMKERKGRGWGKKNRKNRGRGLEPRNWDYDKAVNNTSLRLLCVLVTMLPSFHGRCDFSSSSSRSKVEKTWTIGAKRVRSSVN